MGIRRRAVSSIGSSPIRLTQECFCRPQCTVATRRLPTFHMISTTERGSSLATACLRESHRLSPVFTIKSIETAALRSWLTCQRDGGPNGSRPGSHGYGISTMRETRMTGGIFVFEQLAFLPVLGFTVWLPTRSKPCRRSGLSSRFPMRPPCLIKGKLRIVGERPVDNGPGTLQMSGGSGTLKRGQRGAHAVWHAEKGLLGAACPRAARSVHPSEVKERYDAFSAAGAVRLSTASLFSASTN